MKPDSYIFQGINILKDFEESKYSTCVVNFNAPAGVYYTKDIIDSFVKKIDDFKKEGDLQNLLNMQNLQSLQNLDINSDTGNKIHKIHSSSSSSYKFNLYYESLQIEEFLNNLK
jgi:hypothetical protein